MKVIKQITVTSMLAFSMIGGAHAAPVTDKLGQASFWGCYYATCLPGYAALAGLERASTQMNFEEPASLLGFNVIEPTGEVPAWADRGALTWLGVSSITREAGTNNLLGASLSGGFTFENTLGAAGRVNFSDIRVDVASKTIRANLQGVASSSVQGSPAFSLQDVPLWTFSSVTTPQWVRWPGLNDDDWGDMPEVGQYIVSDLVMTSDGADAVAAGLGWTEATKRQSLTLLPWGNLEMTLAYGHDVTGVPAIPEPSSVALLLAGLAATAVAARRRA